jgi:uncharacterized protein
VSSPTPHRILLTGATGLIGSVLTESLRADGHTVHRVTRRPTQPGDIAWDPQAGSLDRGAVDTAAPDVVVHLAGEGIADAKWTDAHRKRVLDSRVLGTRLIASTIAQLPQRPRSFICGSAVGFYGDRGDDQLNEQSKRGTGFLSDVVVAWEAEAKPASDAGIRTVHARTGIVMTTKGGSLKQQLLPFKLGLGGRLGNGRQWLPWITIDDEVRAIKHLIATDSIAGPVNLSAPNPVTNAQFTKELGRALKRPTLLPIPLAPLKIRYGADMVKEMLLSSTRAVPDALTASGFTFTHPDLAPALHALIDGDR